MVLAGNLEAARGGGVRRCPETKKKERKKKKKKKKRKTRRRTFIEMERMVSSPLLAKMDSTTSCCSMVAETWRHRRPAPEKSIKACTTSPSLTASRCRANRATERSWDLIWK